MSATSRRRFLLTAGAALAVDASVQPVASASASTTAPPKFQLGLVTYNIAKDWDLPTILRVCRETGVTAIEFRTGHKHGVEPSLSPDQRREVKERCRNAGVTIWSCGTVCEFQSPDRTALEKNVETCKQFVGLVGDLGGRGVKVRPNGLPRDVPSARTLEQIGRALVPCGQAAADVGLEIFVEVHGNGTQNPPNMKAIMEHCGHPAVGVCWNSNPTDVANGSVKASFELLRPWIKSCHINELYKDATGTYPYRELFGLLRGMDYDRVTLCEVAQAPRTVEDGTEMLRYYRAIWHELARG